VNWDVVLPHAEATLRLMAERHGVRGLDAATLAPHFAAVEERLSIGPGRQDDVNLNNASCGTAPSASAVGPELIRRSRQGLRAPRFCRPRRPLDAKHPRS